jgi:hypothetical protein
LGSSSIHEQHCDQTVVEEISRISAYAVGAAHGADPVATWVNEQNDMISKVEIGNEARPTEVKNGERNKNYNSREVLKINKTCSICLR